MRPRLPAMTLGENLCALRRRDRRRLRESQHLDRPGAIGEPADETPLLERHDQAMNSGLRAQIERVLHFVEGRRHARLLEALMDETQELALFLGQHKKSSTRPAVIRRLRPTEGEESRPEVNKSRTKPNCSWLVRQADSCSPRREGKQSRWKGIKAAAGRKAKPGRKENKGGPEAFQRPPAGEAMP